MYGDDFKNFLLIKKIEEDIQKKTFWDILNHSKWKIVFGVILLILFIIIYNIFFTKIDLSKSGKQDDLFQINNGESVDYISKRLKDESVLTSATAFKIYMKIFSGSSYAQAGIYKFDSKDNLVSIANKIIKAKYAIPPVKITIPEGSDNREVAEIISKAFSGDINQKLLVDDYSEKNILEKIGEDGYIFPETYMFLPNAPLQQVINTMRYKFYDSLKILFSEEAKELGIYSLSAKEFKLKDYFNDDNKTINLNKRFTVVSDIGTTTLTIKDVIIMASYLEGEANNEKDMKIVAGVLWTRLKLNYPLQIDAATSTYKNKGLTKYPINNPGLIAIKSAISPISTGAIYYITGRDGNMYYAKTYDEHLKNINKYLR